jgi:alcohol dehydrogenase class IV
MDRSPGEFSFTYRGCDILYGRGLAADLGGVLADRDLERALVVCGPNVGSNEALMDPITNGLGDRLAGVFDETTPTKRLETAFDAVDRMDEVDADVLVGVGGGSSLDIARQASLLAADGRTHSEIESAAREGTLSGLDASEPAVPTVVVPTTFAGADVSAGGSLVVLSAEESPTDQPITVGGDAMPIVDVADPDAFSTSPLGALEGSAMNGFDKGIENLYAREGHPFGDATAIHGLEFLRTSLPALSEADPAALDRAVAGILLVQHERKASIIHAFGHAFSRRYPVQQGDVHAVMAPHALRYVLRKVPKVRWKLAAAFGVDGEDEGEGDPIDAIVEEVTRVRDGLDVPRNAGDLEGTRREDIPALAEFAMDDYMMPQAPEELEPTVEELEEVLEAAW